MKHRNDDRQPSLFDAMPAFDDGHEGTAKVQEPEGEYRPGFKKAKRIGWVPDDWRTPRIEKVMTDSQLGGSYPNDESNTGLPLVKMGNIGRGSITLEKIERLPEGEKYDPNHLLQTGDILFNTRNTLNLVGKVALWKGELVPALYDNNLMKMQFAHVEVASHEFMNYVFNSQYALRQLRGYATGTTSVAALYKRDLLKLRIVLPPKPEQRKIVRILDTWDQALAQLDTLIAAKEQRLKGLMQQLLFGKRRFPEFQEQSWRKVQLGKILKEVTRSVDLSAGESARLLSVRRRSEGLFIRDREEIQGSLKIVHEGDFLISRRQVVHGASGLARAEHHGAAVSNSYSVLASRDPEVLDIRFFNWLSKTPELYHVAYLSSYGVHIEKFIFHLRFYFKHKARIPRDVEEQRKILAVLDDAENEIDLLRQERNALAEQKKGLMQRLLTGEVRVTPDPDDLDNQTP